MNTDAVFLSRFRNDLLLYAQNRAGYATSAVQLYWNANLAQDIHREADQGRAQLALLPERRMPAHPKRRRLSLSPDRKSVV